MNDVSKTNGDLIKRARGLAAHSYGGVSRTLRELTDALASATRVPVQGEPNDDDDLIEYALDYIENGTMRPERRKALQALASRAIVPDAAFYGACGVELCETCLPLFDAANREIEGTGSVPDAATELLRIARRDASRFEDEAVDAIAERDAATAAVERVRAIHKVKHGEKPKYADGDYHAEREPVSWEKYSMCEGCSATWPCRTVAALDGAPEPEWDYCFAEIHDDGEIYTYGPDEGFRFATAEDARAARIEESDVVMKRAKGVPTGPWLPVEGEKP